MSDTHVVDSRLGPLTVHVFGSGRPAVLWHSLFVDERSWDRLAPELAATRRLVVITGPGHGSSGDPGRRYGNEECAEAARLVLDRLNIDEAVDWVGNAWGGHVGIIFAATHPDRCRSLVAFGTPIAALTRRERARTYLLLALYRLAGSVPTVVDGVTQVLLSSHTRANDVEAVRLVQDCLRQADRTMLRNAVVSISLHRSDLADLLSRLQQRVLLVTGGDHHGFTAQQARAAVQLLEHSELAVVPDTAYLVPLEAPRACAQLVRGFWAADDGTPTSGDVDRSRSGPAAAW